MNPPHIMVLGIGCLLFRDEGFGVRVVQKLQAHYDFPDHVSLIDGGVLGVNLLGVMSEADYLIVVDAIRHKGAPGDVYRLEKTQIPERIRAKNSLHQIDFLEALTLCQVFDKVPETVIVGVEPEDIDTLCTELSPVVLGQVEPVMAMVLSELERLGVCCQKRSEARVSCNPLENYPH
jgi:hydrogenase maturation protease